jgi:phosphoglycerate dehydrogenase-like enzyme
LRSNRLQQENNVRAFTVALTGDFLDEEGASAFGDAGLASLESAPHVRCHYLREQAPRRDDPGYWDRFYSLEVTAEQVRGVNGLVVLRPWVRRAVFAEGAEELVVVGRSGAGYDKVDLRACTESDVALFNAPMALNHATASSALTLMLALAKRLFQQDRITREGRWDRQRAVLGSEIQGRTLGIVGLGHSGRELARLAAPFEMRIIAYSPHADPAQAEALGVRLTTLEEVMREADFVSLHSRLTAENHRIIGARELALMKPTAYFVNVARGELVDQASLVEALREGRIAGAGLDVFEKEPLPAGDPLIGLENVVLAPHWLASTSDVWQATGKAMAEGMLRAARGEVPENVVNREVLERPRFQAKLARFRENNASR